jgi:hypothetical protein
LVAITSAEDIKIDGELIGKVSGFEATSRSFSSRAAAANASPDGMNREVWWRN